MDRKVRSFGMIRDHSDFGRSNEPINPLWTMQGFIGSFDSNIYFHYLESLDKLLIKRILLKTLFAVQCKKLQDDGARQLRPETNSSVKRGNFMELLICTIMTSDTVSNYANTQNGRL